ncbi:ion transporter [Alteromonas aestuariivivens]|uniref:Ion transporter n=1 Tax=Alteromonas aestuariivivens TaxID=1938339 RepID=A0A3D8M448_9ALTE|nr:ion transporter [Alteromonas aestuariivivens]RDV24304.1 ion transporter [Alteromonas aestuariivivens]
MFRINRENLRKSHETPWLILDLVMLGLLFVNLAWLIFDALFSTAFIYDRLAIHLPGLVNAYLPVHQNFLLVDLIFISIFFVEFCFRWAVAIKRKEHLRWYFFPFLHWYDIVGLIPLGATRIFRFLRIISILHRLHKFQIIDLNQTAVFRFFSFYYDVLVEELSDRIVVKVLSDAQRDIAAGSPLVEDINRQVLAPRRPILTEWMAEVLNHLGSAISDPDSGDALREHVKLSVGKAIRHNPQISTLHYIPVVGRTIEHTLESAVSDIVTSSMINLLSDLDANRIERFITEGLKDFSPSSEDLDKEVLLIINECLELVKSHVAQQRWKSELAEKEQALPELGFEPQQARPVADSNESKD